MAAHQPRLIEDPQGMAFEYVDREEAEFLYEEVFVRRSYLQHGLVVQGGAVVVDAGANIGVFSLHCLKEAKGVQIYAFEPIPANYSVLVRNLYNTSSESVKAGTCPKPVALRVALGADLGEEEFHFFEDNPGESTRHPREREEQRQALKVDPDAASWRQTLGPPAIVPASQQAIRKPAAIISGAGVTKQTHEEQGRVAHLCGDPNPDGDQEVAEAGEHAREAGHERKGGVPFLCRVVPLSLAIQQLEIGTVDLLKVDVEGDELAVLHGIDDEDWPKIRQVALEVHNVDGRLAATVGLLKSKPAAFDEVCWEPQLTSEVSGYVMVVPKTLRMFLVYAKRRRQQSAKPSSIEDGSTAMAPAAAGHIDAGIAGGGFGDAGSEHAGAARLSGVAVENWGGDRGDTTAGALPERFCSCASVGCSSVLPT